MAQEQAKTPEKKPGMPRWKKVMIAGAVVLVLIGAGLKLVGKAARPEPTRPPAADHGTGGLSQPLVAEKSQRSAPARQEEAGREQENRTFSEEISPFFLQGGLSFFVGLAIGAAVRAVFKVTLLIAGVILLGVFALSYFGAIGPIDWASI